ncbi:MAG: nucleotidyltransferase domain-containing protein [Chlorobi bacterium]|nr:nucleotidyltransferase domain-containing protein [Chlorobiota bacterium]
MKNNTLYGLKEEIINKIIEVFKKFEAVDKAILYGSRAKGNYSNGSDIDIALFGDGLNLNILNKIENEIDDLMLPYAFDLSIYNQIKNQNLIERIERVGVEIYSKNNSR